MINAFENCLRAVYNNIPREILDVAFRPSDYQTSLDQRIKDVIILGRVLPDCNTTAGMVKRIPLYMCESVQILPDPGYASILNSPEGALYRIPPSQRENRDIVGVIDISYPYDYTSTNSAQVGFGLAGNSVASLAAAALDSHTHRNACLTPTPRLLAGNMVLINPANTFLSDWVLVCRLGYDEEFTNFNRGSIIPLCNLVLTATKVYIWTHLTIRIDQAVLSGGQELGQFKSIVDGYQSSLEQYNTDLTKLRGSLSLDPSLMRYISRRML